MNRASLFTIGYERRAPEEVLRQLVAVGVTKLFDVRLRPQSRRPGLSKTKLAESCAAAGLIYTHDRRLGTPAEILKGFRDTGTYDWDGFDDYLATQEPALNDALTLVEGDRTALLCYELDPAECHRSVVAKHLGDRSGFSVIHL